ncbi:MAG: hypothetical protein QQN63_04060 [Nitrosopumilus sp.]
MKLTDTELKVLPLSVVAWLGLTYLFAWLARISPDMSMIEGISGVFAIFFIFIFPVGWVLWFSLKMDE